MKKILFGFLLCVAFLHVNAAHIKGGFFTYKYLGPGITNPTWSRYKITLTIYSSPNPSIGPGPGTQIWDPINYTIFQGNNPAVFASVSVNIAQQYVLSKLYANPCITGNNLTGPYYHIIIYVLDNYELPPSPDGYTVSYQKCCRLAQMDNITSSNDVGMTWSINIPGTNAPIPNADHNSSPIFSINDTILVCQNHPFTYNFGTTDPDGDSLSYAFCYAYSGGSQVNINPDPSSPPPYVSVPYSPPYSGSQPLGINATINPVTGLVSGIAPPILNTGEYVVTVCIKEFRNGIYFADSRKELHIRVRDCSPLGANPNFTPITCDGFTVNFTDNSSGNPTDYLWDFGDPASGAANTSILPNPTHTFTAAGIFNIKLIVSIAGQCIDSITKPLSVFPGFFPGFTNSAPLCAGQAVQFTDTTITIYGVVDSWHWDFGDPGSGASNTSIIPAPTHVFVTPGPYNVTLIVTNSKGCQKTVVKPIVISNVSPVSVFPHDSTYCGLDTLQLTGTGTGSFNWTPAYNIIGANTANPMAYPAVPTRYYATLTNAAGCKSIDSLNLVPKFDLTNAIAGPAGICEEDTVTLTGTTNYLTNITWQWSPPGTIESPNNDITRVYPITTTTYALVTRWGNHCVASKTHTITVIPLANPNAGPDTYVCPGNQSSVQLNATGGTTYLWSPATGLSNPNIANPIASPLVPTTYTVSVGVTGCSKLRTDDVFVDVGLPPPLTVMNDTLICIIDTLQIVTSGTGNFTWTPNYMISSTTAQSPFVSPDVPTWYHVRITDAIGCHSDDSIFVDVKNLVTIDAGADTNLCATDIMTLRTTSDALSYIWSPATYLNSATIKNPIATPLTTITYYVIGNIGKCQGIDSVHIKVGPYPPANAGPDALLCPGFSTQLHASGGSIYLWAPVTFLNDRRSPNPTCTQPFGNIRYIVTVTDTLGCTKAVKDTVWVMLHPKAVVDAGPADTTVVEGEPLLLNAVGNGTYLWSPSLWLNSNTIANPIALPHGDITYQVICTTANGCTATDRIKISWYNLDPDMYVPTAFTPDGNGHNDDLKPILRGMKQLNYFRIFNRFGEMVFYTTEEGKGWDGTYKGKPQDIATYVWYAEGVTYKGQLKRKKGYAVLIR